MRHRNTSMKIGGRDRAHRSALMRNLMTQLVLHEKIKTTINKAKLLSTEFEKLMTRVRKQNDLNAIRELDRVFYSDIPGKKVKDVLLKRFEARASGLTRITKLYTRKGDNATVVLIELV